MSCRVLIVYYSVQGGTALLAQEVARGVFEAGGDPILRRVLPLHSQPDNKTVDPSLSKEDWYRCDAVALGSPTRFGNMAAPVKVMIDDLSDLWRDNVLDGKPAGVFTSSASLHGGQESTLLSMQVPLLHLGAVIVGVSYQEAALHATHSGGTPYGPSHWSGRSLEGDLSVEEKVIASALGKRLATFGAKLCGS